MGQEMQADEALDGRTGDEGADNAGVDAGFDRRAASVRRLVAPSVGGAGYDLVRVEFPRGDRQTLQIMIERHDLAPITVDDCAGVSRLLSAILDVEDPLPGRYTLEVSSPGLDRPLVRIEDYERFAGFEARIEMTRPIDGRRRFQGRLRGAEDGLVQIECDDAAAAIPFSGIRRASLVVTDDLIEAAAREANAALSKQ
jgi:ribosome maturation factor RimP